MQLFDTIGRDGGNPPYDQGRTATHEVGHYLGLHHTFSPNHGVSGVCENGWNNGDLIQDTPAQGDATFGCPDKFLSCGEDAPSYAGNIHNYMDYTDDTCMFYFTIQQANRSVCSLVIYRPNLYRSVPAIYNVDNYIESQYGGGVIPMPKQPVPAGTEIVIEALPTVPSNQPAPTWNARIILQRKLLGQHDWELVDIDISSGLTSAKITHTVPTRAHYQWSVSHEEGGTPGPHTANITYLSCADPDEPNGIKNIPECRIDLPSPAPRAPRPGDLPLPASAADTPMSGAGGSTCAPHRRPPTRLAPSIGAVHRGPATVGNSM